MLRLYIFWFSHSALSNIIKSNFVIYKYPFAFWHFLKQNMGDYFGYFLNKKMHTDTIAQKWEENWAKDCYCLINSAQLPRHFTLSTLLSTHLIIEQFPRNIIQDKWRVHQSDRALVQTNKHTGLILVYWSRLSYQFLLALFFKTHDHSLH